MTPLATVSVGVGHQSKTRWEATGREAADELFRFAHIRIHPDPGTLIYLSFDQLDFTEDLLNAAIAAFNERWKQLVPGWEPQIKDAEVLAQ